MKKNPKMELVRNPDLKVPAGYAAFKIMRDGKWIANALRYAADRYRSGHMNGSAAQVLAAAARL